MDIHITRIRTEKERYHKKYDRVPVTSEEKVLRKKRDKGIECSGVKIQGKDYNRQME